jgi:predicted HTH transcriptional regulator
MRKVSTLKDIAALRESYDVECKLAQGRDGDGQLPKDVWETYSAFANTQGGDIFLGLKENDDDTFELAGIKNTRKVLDQLWANLNDPKKVSVNILSESRVCVLEIEGQYIIQIHVPQASALERPVYLNSDPLSGAYQRFGSSDHLIKADIVHRMLAQRAESK